MSRYAFLAAPSAFAAAPKAASTRATAICAVAPAVPLGGARS
ncbi:hypothetical protein [Streptomyces sp. NPDC048361]